MSTQHTPTPWRATRTAFTGDPNTIVSVVIQGSAYTEVEQNVASIRVGNQDAGLTQAEANAAFIVLAVNAHDELVAALRLALAVAENNQLLTEAEMLSGETYTDTRRRMVDEVRAALARVAP